MLFEEIADSRAGRQSEGRATWRKETLSSGSGQGTDIGIRADIEIINRNVGMTWSLRRNSDRTLSASHAIEIAITLPADFSHGNAQRVPGVLMKEEMRARGKPLAGRSIKVNANVFLIGLLGDEINRPLNMQRLRELSCIDVPVVFDDGSRAIVAIEKGAQGESVFNEVFASWASEH